MTAINDRAIGLRLLALRLKLGISEREAARRAGVSPRSWRRWEYGNPCRTGSVLKICAAFGLSIDWLVCGDKAVAS